MRKSTRLFDLEKEFGVRTSSRQKPDDVESLHELRLTLKKLKALIRLVHPFARERADDLLKRVRKLARALNEQRDADVIAAWLETNGVPNPSPNPTKIQAKSAVRAKAIRRTQQRLMNSKPEIDLLIKELVRPKGELSAVLEREWRTANKLRRRAKKIHRETDFHRWRHEVKNLQYQFELLAGDEARIGGIKKLGSTLGRVHDLSIISDYLKQTRVTGHRKLLKKAARDQKHLEKVALKSGKRIFNGQIDGRIEGQFDGRIEGQIVGQIVGQRKTGRPRNSN